MRARAFARSALVVAALLAVVAVVLRIDRREPAPAAPAAVQGSVGSSTPPARWLEHGPAPAAPDEREAVLDTRHPASPPKLVITGRVLNAGYPDPEAEPTPAAGSTVRVSLSSSPPTEKGHEATTDPEGRFRIERADPGKRRLGVSVSADGDERYRSANARRDLRAGDDPAIDVVLRRVEHGALHGRAVGGSGEPLAGVLLALAPNRPGSERRETFSGPDGRFRFESAVFGRLAASLEGYALLERLEPRMLQTGGWEEMLVVLVPTSRLTVLVADSSGNARAGVAVSVAPAPTELERPAGEGWGSNPATLRAQSNVLGEATFDPVWSGKRLRVEVGGRGSSLATERAAGGELVFDEGRTGDPIVVPVRGDLVLVARLAPEIVLRGRVLSAAREPAAGARIQVNALERHRGSFRGAPLETRADGEGRFELALAGARGRQTVLAADGAAPAGTFLASGEPMRNAAMVVVDPAEAHGGEIEVELVLEPLLSITGVVNRENGNPARGHVRAVPAGAGYAAETSFGVRYYADIDAKDGSFEISSLPEGTYDLFVPYQIEDPTSIAIRPATVWSHRRGDARARAGAPRSGPVTRTTSACTSSASTRRTRRQRTTCLRWRAAGPRSGSKPSRRLAARARRTSRSRPAGSGSRPASTSSPSTSCR
ncbi:MAG TPA: carboxypeptidase-like regulatory domain-containing protein [Planctomycetota bacterium]|nr:carboxypeptidase-like regulatory domain-containing protein [Planctomycetota bacterium]